MILALTGTPGTGKTGVATLLKNKGYEVVNINRLAVEKKFLDGYDKNRECYIIDVKKVEKFLKKDLFRKNKNIILDGHLSHFINDVDAVIILRCHPRELERRLKEKGWKKEKIRENVEAEILDIILCEAVEIHDKVFEIDTTDKSKEEVAEIIDGILNGRFNKGEYNIGKIDWTEEDWAEKFLRG